MRDTENVRLIIDLQKLIMQWVPLQRATTFLRSSKKAAILRIPVQRATLSLNEERRHIANPSATGNQLRSTQGSICNTCRVARTVENKNYLT